jgi:hypothetical protein
VFGSRAKGNYRSAPDLDLCLDAPGLNLASPGAGKISSTIFCLWKIDIVLLDTIDNPALREHIDRVGIPSARLDRTLCQCGKCVAPKQQMPN